MKEFKVTISEEALEKVRLCINEKETDDSELIKDLFFTQRQADNEYGYNEVDVRGCVTVEKIKGGEKQ